MDARPTLLRLDEPKDLPEVPFFDTYKQCHELICEQDVFTLPSASEPFSSALVEQRFPTALEAEADVRGIGGRMVSLFRGEAVAAVLQDGRLVIRPLSPSSNVHCIACDAPIVSIASCARVDFEGKGQAEDQDQDIVVVGTAHGSVSFVVVSRSCGTGAIVALLQTSTKLVPVSPPLASSNVWVTAACVRDAAILAIAHRVVRSGEVEVVVLRLDAESAVECAEPLAVLRGHALPRCSCFCDDARTALIVGEAGFGEAGGEAWEPMHLAGEGSAVVTVLDCDAARSSCWSLPYGELLTARPDGGCLLAVLGEHGGGVVALRLGVGGEGVAAIEACRRVPGLGACADARSELRLVLVSPSLTFFALAQASGQNAVAVFRNPEGATRAPTASANVETGLGDNELLGALLTDNAIFILTTSAVVRCGLDPGVRIAEQPQSQIRSDQMPMGLNPTALLRMLDMQEEA